MAIDLSTFWSTWGVTAGNTSATNQYEFWKGMVMSNGQVLNNQYEFFQYHNTTRYEWFRDLQTTYPEVYNEYTFYRNTSDDRIYDMSTFYEFGATYLGGGTTTTTTTAPPVNSMGLLGGWDGFSEEIPMTSEDGENWEILAYQMPEGSGSYSTYFRQNNSIDWGGTDFPIGIAYVGASPVPSVFGEYNIYFNSTTGVYEFDSLAPALPYLFSNGTASPDCDTVSAQTLYTQSPYIYDGLVLYADSGRTEVFSGGGLYYTEINTDGFNYETMNISNAGVVSNVLVCSHPYLFSDQNITPDCNAVSAQTLYCAYSPPQDYRSMCTDYELTIPFSGGGSSYTYISDSGDGIGTMDINESGLITSYTPC